MDWQAGQSHVGGNLGQRMEVYRAAENTSFNETWFVGNAVKADASKEMNRIYAVSYKQTGTYFPMTWERSERYVPAVDVTGFYTSRKKIQIRLEEYDGADNPMKQKSGSMTS